jgi:hypothetical protein
MSDLSVNNNAWLSKLRSHLDTESYTAGTVGQYMGVARRFVADLNKQRVAITATRPEDIDRYLQRAPWPGQCSAVAAHCEDRSESPQCRQLCHLL